MEPHSIDCPCVECKEIRRMLKYGEQTKRLHLVGMPEDLKKIRNEKL